MNRLLTKVLGDKKEWRRMEARAALLPRDYRIVYGEIKKYLWRFGSDDGRDTFDLLGEILATFESATTEGRRVLEVTGEDVAAFCDGRLRGAHPYGGYLAKWRRTLNDGVAKKL